MHSQTSHIWRNVAPSKQVTFLPTHLPQCSCKAFIPSRNPENSDHTVNMFIIPPTADKTAATMTVSRKWEKAELFLEWVSELGVPTLTGSHSSSRTPPAPFLLTFTTPQEPTFSTHDLLFHRQVFMYRVCMSRDPKCLKHLSGDRQ